MNQEMISLGIVGLAAGHIFYRFYKGILVEPISRWLLRNGFVSLAMKARKQALGSSSCSGCQCRTQN